jgi:hypothetical protein
MNSHRRARSRTGTKWHAWWIEVLVTDHMEGVSVCGVALPVEPEPEAFDLDDAGSCVHCVRELRKRERGEYVVYTRTLEAA